MNPRDLANAYKRPHPPIEQWLEQLEDRLDEDRIKLAHLKMLAKRNEWMAFMGGLLSGIVGSLTYLILTR